MVPLADMLNADADRNNAKLFYEDDKVIMKAIAPIRAGEEIFNDYGPLPTADVLRRYGYTTENYARYDVVEVSLVEIVEAVKAGGKVKESAVEERTQYLEGHEVLEDSYDIARPAQEEIDQFPDEICVVLNTLALPDAAFAQLKKKNKLPKPDFTEDTITLLLEILQSRSEVYMSNPILQEQGHDTMETDVPTSRRKEMARRVVEGEVQVVRLALEMLRNKVNAAALVGKRPAPEESLNPAKKQKR